MRRTFLTDSDRRERGLYGSLPGDSRNAGQGRESLRGRRGGAPRSGTPAQDVDLFDRLLDRIGFTFRV